MPEEIPYVPHPVTTPDGRSLAQADLPAPDLQFTRPRGAWVIVGALFFVVIALFGLVAMFFSQRA
jgi:hypothetical protein